MKIKKTIFIVLLLIFLASPFLVFGQEITYPRLPGAQAPQDFLKTASQEDMMGLWVKYIINLCTWAAGLLAFLALIAGGIRLLISTGKPENIIAARQQISNAFLGLLIVLSAYFILRILSPYFLDFTLPNIEKIAKMSKLPNLPPQDQDSTIDIYIPVGRIIENIFQTYYSNKSDIDKENPVAIDTETRIQRITNNLDATLALLPTIVGKAQLIKNLSDDCSCWELEPDPKCNHEGCDDCPPFACTSDPCQEVRGRIVDTEKELQPYLFGDIENIIQHDAYGSEYSITTNLTKELAKTEEEIRLLKYWFNKLGRAEKFMRQCDWQVLNNRNQYFQTKDLFEKKGLVAEGANFWDDADIVFYKPKSPANMRERWYPKPGTPLEQVADESTLYCAVGGTYSPEPVYFETGPEWTPELEKIGNLSEEQAGKVLEEFSYKLACDINIPYGEVLDKSHRMARLLINNLETVADRGEKMLESIDRLEVLVSQCSSSLCFPFCICITVYGVKVCIGSPYCFGPGCPNDEIDREIEKIKQYNTEITNAINGTTPYNGKLPYNSPERMGIKPLFNDLVPDLLESMEKTIRDPMEQCVYEKPVDADVAFWPCAQALGGTDASGKMINKCMAGTKGEWKDTLYGGCLNNCFLTESSQTKKGNYTPRFEASKYHQCLDECMALVCIYNYNHELNFFCCHTRL